MRMEKEKDIMDFEKGAEERSQEHDAARAMYGTCKYCGQRMLIRGAVGQNLRQTDLDKIASDECGCREGDPYRRAEMQMATLKAKIKSLGGGKIPAQAVRLIEDGLNDVMSCAVDEFTVKYHDTKVQLKLASDGIRMTVKTVHTEVTKA